MSCRPQKDGTGQNGFQHPAVVCVDGNGEKWKQVRLVRGVCGCFFAGERGRGGEGESGREVKEM